MSRFPDPPPSPKRSGFQIGRLLAGLVIVAFGIGWLLEALGAATVPWRVVLPGALILIGVALVLSARSGREHGGLITLGGVLTVVLAVGTVVNVPVDGGIGDRSERPAGLQELKREYRLGVGQLTLDLTRVRDLGDRAKPLTVEVHVGIGRLLVIVSKGTLVEVHGRAGIGRVSIFGHDRSGLNVQNGFVPRMRSGAALLFSLDVSVGIGDVEVRYG